MEKIKTINITPENAKEMAETWNKNFLLKAMGVKIDLSDDKLVKARIDHVQDFHRGGMGTKSVNGAVLSSLFDLVIGLVGIVNSNGHRTGTVQLNINFLKPLFADTLNIEATLIKSGKSLVFARAEAFNDKGEVCATCDGICSIDTSKPIVENYMAI
ncbi:MAG: PaaI family thioesterase [Candidatus Sericytochromatia bacterium]